MTESIFAEAFVILFALSVITFVCVYFAAGIVSIAYLMSEHSLWYGVLFFPWLYIGLVMSVFVIRRGTEEEGDEEE